MTDDTAPAPAPAARHRLRWLTIAAASVLLLLGLAVWLGGREAALQLLARRIEAASKGDLVVTGVRGSLYGRMHVDRVVLRSPQRVITATDIDLVWAASSLLRRAVAVERVEVGAVVIEQLAKSEEPLTLPATLAPPLGLSVDVARARVRKLSVNAGGNRTGVDDIVFGLHGDGTRWTLRDASASTPWGRLTAQAAIGAQRPFALDGKAQLAAREAAASAQASGNLSDLRLALLARGRGGSADIRLGLAPFAPIMLRTLKLEASNIDPFLWEKSWPKADFDAAIAASVTPLGAITGDVRVENRGETGPIDRQRVPLRALTATLRGSFDLLRIDGVLIDLGSAGRFTGSGTLGGKAGPDAAFLLRTDRLDLSQIASAMHPTRIAGTVALAHSGKTGRLEARLAQDGFLLDARATLAAGSVTVQRALLRAKSSAVELTGTMNLAGARPFRASGSVAHFNPADFGRFPRADINAGLDASGQAAQPWRVDARFALRPSRFADQALSGRGTLRADSAHIAALDAELALGANRLAAKGAFGAAGDRLAWNLDARQLAVVKDGLAGAVIASGVATGSYAAPATTFTLAARNLRWEDEASGAPADGSELRATGSARLQDRVPHFSVRGSASRFDPQALSALGKLPQGRIDGDFTAAGRLGEQWDGTLDLALRPSTLLGSPLSGHARIAADWRHVSRADVDLRLAANRLTAQGRFGARGDTLAWRLDAPQLAALGSRFGGQLQAAGQLSGTMAAPSVRIEGSGSALKFGAHTLRSASLNVQASSQPGTPLSARLSIADYRAPAPVFDTLTMDLSGTSDAHALRVAAKSPDVDANAEIAGRWRAGDWQGELRTLQNRGRNAIALRAPAPLRFAVLRDAKGARLDRLALGPAVFGLRRGSITLQTLEKNGPHWKTAGQASGVPVRYLANFSPAADEIVGGDLTVAANWTAEFGAELNGSLRVVRESGDLALGADLPVLLGLSAFEAQVTLARNALQARFDMQGTRSGTLHVDAAATLARQDGRWRLADASPLRLNARADMPSIAWLAPVIGPVGLELGGRLTAAVTGAGTVGAPQLQGQVNGDALTVDWPEHGIALRNGQLRAQLAGEQLQLQTLRFEGKEGQLRADGSISLAGAAPAGKITLSAEHLQLLARPDRVLVLSGQATATLAPKRLDVEGRFTADRAAIEIERRNGLTVSDDVVVVRGSQQPVARAAREPALGVYLDVEADLGERFRLSGMGLEARIAGAVRLRARPGELPRATGTIRVAEGTYRAYGQDLAIERGVLNFNGPLDNPSINILAMRRNQDKTRLFATSTGDGVDAGVEVRGSARAPVAKLISEPNVPDSEKLSWLVLGHGTEGSSAREFNALGAAASALLSSKQAAALQGRLAGSLGVDSIGLNTAGGLESTVLTVGKRLSQRAYLTFERGASNASNLVKLNYALTRRLSLQIQAGTNTAFDILYSWAFD